MLPFELTKDTPYLALSGELWSVFYEYFNRNWSCYKGFLLYLFSTPCSCTHLDDENGRGGRFQLHKTNFHEVVISLMCLRWKSDTI